jgi:hypothetical protein
LTHIGEQVVLDIVDIPAGTTLLFLCQTLGGSVFNSVAETTFTNKLLQYVVRDAPGVSPELVLKTGATAIQSAIPAKFLAGVTQAYNDALDQTFVVATVISAIGLIGGLCVEWRSVKKKKPAKAEA